MTQVSDCVLSYHDTYNTLHEVPYKRKAQSWEIQAVSAVDSRKQQKPLEALSRQLLMVGHPVTQTSRWWQHSASAYCTCCPYPSHHLNLCIGYMPLTFIVTLWFKLAHQIISPPS